MKLGEGSYHIDSKSRHMEKMNGAMHVMYQKRNDEHKRKNVSRLLEKESRDDGRRLQQCSGSMDI